MDAAILFMYLFAFALIPLIGFGVFLLVDGDRMRARQPVVQRSTVEATVEPLLEPARAPGVASRPDAAA